MTKETMNHVVFNFSNAFNGGNDVVDTEQLLADVDVHSLTRTVDTQRLAALVNCMYGRIPVTTQLVFTMDKDNDYRLVPGNAYTLATVSALHAYVHGDAVPDANLVVDDMAGAYADLRRSRQRQVDEAKWHMTRFMTTADAEAFGKMMDMVQG